MLNVKQRKDSVYYFDLSLWLIQKEPHWVKENTVLHVEEIALHKWKTSDCNKNIIC